MTMQSSGGATSVINARLMFFGATADIVGAKELLFAISAGENVDNVVARVVAEHPALKDYRLCLALNQEYIKGGEKIREGDELAIFTAVSGG